MFIKLAKFVLLPCTAGYALSYPCFVLVISTLSALVEIPADFSCCKYVAEIFVKYLWFYLTVKLLLFLLCTQYTLTAGRFVQVLPACLRLALNIGFVYVGKFFIDFQSALYGECSCSAYKTAYKCAEEGCSWTSHKLPLSCFLIFYGMLVLLEEAKMYEEWEEVEYVIRRKYELDAKNGGDVRAVGSEESFVDVEKVISLYGKNSIIVKISYCTLAITIVLMHIANVAIIAFTPTPPMVVLSTLVAVIVWLITYRLLYRIEFCTFKKSVHRAKIEEYLTVAESNSEKNNAIEEIVVGNETKPKVSRATWLFSGIYKPRSYDSL